MATKDEIRLLLKKAFTSEYDFEKNQAFLLEKVLIPNNQYYFHLKTLISLRNS